MEFFFVMSVHSFNQWNFWTRCFITKSNLRTFFHVWVGSLSPNKTFCVRYFIRTPIKSELFLSGLIYHLIKLSGPASFSAASSPPRISASREEEWRRAARKTSTSWRKSGSPNLDWPERYKKQTYHSSWYIYSPKISAIFIKKWLSYKKLK